MHVPSSIPEPVSKAPVSEPIVEINTNFDIRSINSSVPLSTATLNIGQMNSLPINAAPMNTRFGLFNDLNVVRNVVLEQPQPIALALPRKPDPVIPEWYYTILQQQV